MLFSWYRLFFCLFANDWTQPNSFSTVTKLYSGVQVIYLTFEWNDFYNQYSTSQPSMKCHEKPFTPIYQKIIHPLLPPPLIEQSIYIWLSICSLTKNSNQIKSFLFHSTFSAASWICVTYDIIKLVIIIWWWR